MKTTRQHPFITSRILNRLVFVSIAFAACLIAERAYADPDIDYVLTAPTDPVKPGQVLEFDVTVRNLSASSQYVDLFFTVPEFTTYGGSPAGTLKSYNFGYVAAGTSQTAKLLFVVSGANLAPPDGTTIDLTLTDSARAASVSRSVVVRAVPALNLQLSTEQGTVAPGTNFTYTLIASNISGASHAGVALSVPVPAGASFVSADGGGAVSAGVVSWSLGTLGVAANEQVHVTFNASATVNTPLGPVDATLSDSSGDVARASDTRAIYAVPAVDYVLTAPTDPVKPGQVLEFDVTVSNLSASSQYVDLFFTVPEFTTYGGSPFGTLKSYVFGYVAAGTSQTAKLLFVVSGGNLAPPDGTVITLMLTDTARAVTFSRDVVVRAVPALNLQLSTEQGTVAPGTNFTYTLIASNISGASHAGVALSVPVPAGASFVSADGGGAVSAGVVNWSLGTLGVAANEQVHVTFNASATVNTPLGPVDATLSDSSGDVARASDTRAIYAVPAVDYVLTAPTDPVKPGQVLEFDVTVRNLSASSQFVDLFFTVPEFTTYGGSPAGTLRDINFGYVAAGTSQTAKLLFVVSGANLAPPDGTTIDLTLTDSARAASVSRSVVVRAVPALNLQLSTEQGTVAPGTNFTYTLTTSNISGASHAGVALSVPVPAGASFVSADGGGAVSAGVVSWSLGTLGVAANEQVHVTFNASATVNTPLGPVDATLSDSSGDVARASDTRAIYAVPAVDYVLTAPTDPVKPGQVLEFDVTVSNLSASSQYVDLFFTVPEFTTYGGSPAGTLKSYVFGYVAAGTSQTAKLLFVVSGANLAPPDGTTIDLTLTDSARAASVSRSVVVRAVPALNLQLSTEQGTVAPGTNFTYTLTTSNISGASHAGVALSVPVPAGASFVSADGGGAVSAGVVSWSLGTLISGAIQQVHVTFKASATVGTPLGPVDATLNDDDGDVTRASDTRAVYAIPNIEYTITSPTDPVKAGDVAEFDVTVSNLSASSQFVDLFFTVPEFTTYGGSPAGTLKSYDFGYVAAGTSQTAILLFTIDGGNTPPPPGATITLDLVDGARAGAVSQTIFVASAPTPVIISPLSATTTVGELFVYQIVATGEPTSYAATNLPAGLTVDSGGTITGMATKVGSKQVILSATNATGTGTATLALDVQAIVDNDGIDIISGSSVTGRTGAPFTYQVIATGINSDATITTTALPPGLTIDSATGEISGTPSQDGSFGVEVTVHEGTRTATFSLQLTFTSDPGFPVITSATNVTLIRGQPFSYTITAPNSADPVTDPTTFSISGSLPAGLTFDPATGTISGTFVNRIIKALSGGGTMLASAASSSPAALPNMFSSGPLDLR